MFSGGSKGNIGKKRVNCCREASVNLSRYSEAVIYTNIAGDMGGSNGSIDGILLENINKEIQINFSLIITPVKDTPSISKTSTISKPENYIDENYDETAKIQLKQAVLREVKQKLPNETKQKGHLDELLLSPYNQISSLKSETGFLRVEVKKKNNVIRTLLRRNSCGCKSSSSCESPKLDNISENNEEHCDTCISTTSNPIQSDSARQFTKLTKQKSRVKEIKIDSVIQAYPKIDSVIQAYPDERTRLTNTEITSSNINEMSHVMNKENRPPDKERHKPPSPSQNPTIPQKSKTSVFIVGGSMIEEVDGYLLTSSLKHQYLVKTRPF